MYSQQWFTISYGNCVAVSTVIYDVQSELPPCNSQTVPAVRLSTRYSQTIHCIQGRLFTTYSQTDHNIPVGLFTNYSQTVHDVSNRLFAVRRLIFTTHHSIFQLPVGLFTTYTQTVHRIQSDCSSYAGRLFTVYSQTASRVAWRCRWKWRVVFTNSACFRF